MFCGAFPKGAIVVLDDGIVGDVLSQAGGTRWDRPLVRGSKTDDDAKPQTHDLMLQRDGRFVQRIRGTAFFCGRASGAHRIPRRRKSGRRRDLR